MNETITVTQSNNGHTLVDAKKYRASDKKENKFCDREKTGGRKIPLVLIGVFGLILFAALLFSKHKSTREVEHFNEGLTGLYTDFLCEYSSSEWHTVWEQLLNNSVSLTVPLSFVSLYEDEKSAADALIEHIATYAFWVDDTGTNGQYAYKYGFRGLAITGIVYYPAADAMYTYLNSALVQAVRFIKTPQGSTSPLELVETISSYICSVSVYGENSPTKGRTVYSTLVEGQALCSGYARTFHVLALLAGLDSRIVTGYLVNAHGGLVRHAWNVVTISGSDYYTDVTANDTGQSNVINQTLENLLKLGYVISGEHAAGVRQNS